MQLDLSLFIMYSYPNASTLNFVVASFSPVYFKRLNLRAFNEQIPLIFKWVEHKCFDVVSNSSQIMPTRTSSGDLWSEDLQILHFVLCVKQALFLNPLPHTCGDSLVSGESWSPCGSEEHGHTHHTGCHTSRRGSVPVSPRHHGCHTEAARRGNYGYVIIHVLMQLRRWYSRSLVARLSLAVRDLPCCQI